MSKARGQVLVWVLLFAAVSHGLGAPLATRSGWVYVPGAQDLIQAGQWGCTSSVTAGSSSLTISATGSGYNTVIDTLGPLLRVQGDFSVLATLSTASNSGTFLTLVGALNTGSDWWNGLKRLDVGVGQATVQVNYWTGGSSSASGQVFALPPGAQDPVNLEVALIADQIVVFVNGSQVGSSPTQDSSPPGRFISVSTSRPKTISECLRWLRPCRRARMPRCSPAIFRLPSGPVPLFEILLNRPASRGCCRRSRSFCRCRILAGGGTRVQPDCPGKRHEVRRHRASRTSV